MPSIRGPMLAMVVARPARCYKTLSTGLTIDLGVILTCDIMYPLGLNTSLARYICFETTIGLSKNAAEESGNRMSKHYQSDCWRRSASILVRSDHCERRPINTTYPSSQKICSARLELSPRASHEAAFRDVPAIGIRKAFGSRARRFPM